jgi:hypothetical protein
MPNGAKRSSSSLGVWVVTSSQTRRDNLNARITWVGAIDQLFDDYANKVFQTHTGISRYDSESGRAPYSGLHRDDPQVEFMMFDIRSHGCSTRTSGPRPALRHCFVLSLSCLRQARPVQNLVPRSRPARLFKFPAGLSGRAGRARRPAALRRLSAFLECGVAVLCRRDQHQCRLFSLAFFCSSLAHLHCI